MKKIIIFIIISILSLFFSIILFDKQEKIIEENINNFNLFSFYKEELKKEYLSYQEKEHLDDKKTVLYVNIGLNRPFYNNPKEALNLDSITILVNKYNYLRKDYVPNNLIVLDEYAKPSIRLNKEAYLHFKKMALDASKNDLNLRIVSAYRSYEYQENLYNNYLKYESKEDVDKYSARAGFSEHQTGLAVDIDNKTINYNQFHLTKEFNWVSKNAHKYGFILRYPNGKENITGYKYEPWHYRYVGNKIATYIYEHNITYEEYYYEFLDK